MDKLEVLEVAKKINPAISLESDLITDGFYNSIEMISLIVMLEETFGVEISPFDINEKNFNNVSTITKYLEKNLNSAKKRKEKIRRRKGKGKKQRARSVSKFQFPQNAATVLDFLENAAAQTPRRIAMFDQYGNKATFENILHNAQAIGTYIQRKYKCKGRPFIVLERRNVKCLIYNVPSSKHKALWKVKAQGEKSSYQPSASILSLHKFAAEDMELFRKIGRQHYKRLMPRLENDEKELTQDQIDEIYRYWDEKTNGLYRPDIAWHQMYFNRTGIFDPRFIDNSFQYYFIVDRLNDEKYSVYKNKNYVSKLFSEYVQPKTVIRRIKGIWYDADFQIINEESALGQCVGLEKEIIIKPCFNTSGGKGIQVLREKLGNREVKAYLAGYKGDIIVQEVIQQHPTLAAIAPDSVNTLRIMTVLIDGQVSPVSAVLRMGVRSRVDNFSQGGIACGVGWDGYCTEHAADKQGKMYDRHPMGTEFAGVKVPSFDKAVEMAKGVHSKLPMFTVVSSDIAIREDGEPVLIEFNIQYGQVDLHQANNGPVYGNLTEKMIDLALKDYFVKGHTIVYMLHVYKEYVKVDHMIKPQLAITIPDNYLDRPVTKISPRAFEADKILKKINFGKNLTRISSRCCKDCTALEGFNMSRTKIKSIGKEAFCGCESLSCAVLKKPLVKIEERAFAECPNLKSVKLASTVSYIAPDAFEGCGKLTIYGDKGSYAEEYADKYGIPFVPFKMI